MGEKEAKVVATCCGSAPPGRARWTLRLLTERIVELNIVESVSHESVSHETVRRCLKKRTEDLAKKHVVHPTEAQRRVRISHGNRAGSLPASV